MSIGEHVSGPTKTLIGTMFAGVGNILCWAQSTDLGVFAAQLSAIGLVIGGMCYAIMEGISRGITKIQEARLKADVERDKAMAPSVTREFQALKRQMEEDRRKREEMARRLEVSEEEKHQLILKLTRSVDQANETMQGNTEKINKIERAVQSGPRILIVEDDQQTSGVMVRFLKARGFQVDFAANVTEGKSKLLTLPQFVILDVMLPDGSGFDVLREIRTRNMPTKVIMCSALDNSDPTYAAFAADLLPDFTVRKPANIEILLAYLADPSDSRPHLSDMDLPKLSGDDFPVMKDGQIAKDGQAKDKTRSAPTAPSLEKTP